MLCSVLGMIDFKHLALDGRKIQASANFRNNVDRARGKKQLELEPKRLILEKALEETVGPLGVRCVLGERILQVSQQIVERG